MKIINLRCEYLRRPVIQESRPRLSWMVVSETPGWGQSTYQIQVAETPVKLEAGTPDLWDSGIVASTRNFHIVYDGKRLSSGQRCFWRVRVGDQNGTITEWSETAEWEMGLLQPEDWQGKWIGGNRLFRQEFKLPHIPSRVTAYLCGVGYHELYLNGQKVGNDLLSPAQTDYPKKVFYNVYDVTSLLRAGTNAIGVILGDGFFAQSAVRGRFAWAKKPYGQPRFIMQLNAYERGEAHALLVSDESWVMADGPILCDNVYAGECYDARMEISNWANPYLTQGTWEKAEITASPGGTLFVQNVEPIRAVREIAPVRLIRHEQFVVYDLGENIAGWVRLKVKAVSGTAILLTFAEEIDSEGNIDYASTGVFATGCTQTDEYICKGNEWEIWEPRFTYHGFRYVEVRGYQDGATLDTVTGIVIRSNVEIAGGFSSDDLMLNKDYEIAIRTLEGNLHGIPTDCPAREKCGWLGDAQLLAEFSICNFHMPSFWTKYIDDIQTSLFEGIPRYIAPGLRTGSIASPDWGSACVQLPWYMYLYYGDTRILTQNYDMMRNWVEYLARRSENGIVAYGLGDWCPPGTLKPTRTPVPLTSTAYYYYDTRLLADIAAVIGRNVDADSYAQKAEQIKAAFQNRFFTKDAHSFGSQTADAFALFLDLVPVNEVDAVAARLNRDLCENCNYHHTTGITGSKYLYNELSSRGYGDTAMKVLTGTTYPSIGYLISQGATTLWETWERTPSDEPTPRSRNHPMQTGFATWFHQYLCGIRPDPGAPGFKHIIIAPCFPSSLNLAQAWQDTMMGRIKSAWERVPQGIVLTVSIPANSTATIKLPHPFRYSRKLSEITVSSGDHSFILNVDENIIA